MLIISLGLGSNEKSKKRSLPSERFLTLAKVLIAVNYAAHVLEPGVYQP